MVAQWLGMWELNVGDVVTQWIECQIAVLKFRGSIPAWVKSGIPNLGNHLLGREPGVPWTCDRCRSAVQTSAEEEENYPEGTSITAMKAGGGIRCISAEIVSANEGECGWMYEKLMMLMSMEGRSWQSPTPKQQLPRTDIMWKPPTHKNDWRRM